MTQFVSWLEGMFGQRIETLSTDQETLLSDRIRTLLKSTSDTKLGEIKTPFLFVRSVLNRLSVASERKLKKNKNKKIYRLQEPLCVEVNSETLTLFLHLARRLLKSKHNSSLKSLLRVMSLNLNIMCTCSLSFSSLSLAHHQHTPTTYTPHTGTDRVPGISNNIINEIRDLLLTLSGIKHTNNNMTNNEEISSLASAALEGALELFLPAPEAQVTFVRHLVQGSRKELLTRVLKHLHDSTHCTFSIVPNPTSDDECPVLNECTKRMISSLLEILSDDDKDEESSRASLKLIFHLISNVMGICAQYATVSLQVLSCNNNDNKITTTNKVSLNDTISLEAQREESRSKRLAQCASPIVDMLDIVCARIRTFKALSRRCTLLTMRILDVLLASLGTYPFDLKSSDSDELVNLRRRIMQATGSTIRHISTMSLDNDDNEGADNTNDMIVRLESLILVNDSSETTSTSTATSSSTTTTSRFTRWEYLFRGRFTPFTPPALNERLNMALQRDIPEIPLRLTVPPRRRQRRRHRRDASQVNVLVSLEENRMMCNTDLTLHDVPVRQVQIDQKEKEIKQEKQKKNSRHVMKTSSREVHNTIRMLSETYDTLSCPLTNILDSLDTHISDTEESLQRYFEVALF